VGAAAASSAVPNFNFGIDEHFGHGKIVPWAKQNDRLVPTAGHLWFWRCLPTGRGQRTFQCFECDRPDPLKTDRVKGWLKGELRPPE
jgi:hypothetical protein